MKKFTTKEKDYHDKNKLKEDIQALRANGMTSLSSGMALASSLFDKVPGKTMTITIVVVRLLWLTCHYPNR